MAITIFAEFAQPAAFGEAAASPSSVSIALMFPLYGSQDIRNPYLKRPPQVSAIASFQFVKAALLLIIAILPFFGGEGRLAYIPNLPDILFLASHGKDPHGLLIVFLGVYAAVIDVGLWRLKRWARNSLLTSSGLMLVFWFAHRDFGTSLIIMPAVSLVATQTVYILLTCDFVIFMYLRFHTETAQAFPTRTRN
jgi:hypothetical protein